MLRTWVGEPLRPTLFSSAPMSDKVSFLIAAFFAAIFPFREGILGVFNSRTTVRSTGSEASTTSKPSSISL